MNDLQIGGAHAAAVQMREPVAARLGQRRVAVGDPQAPRIGGGLGAQAKRLGERILNALTPHGMRANSKVRIAHQDYAERTDSVLRQVAGGRTSGSELLQALEGLRQEAAPITSRGGHYKQLLQDQLRGSLGRLDADSLHGLGQFLQGDSVGQTRDRLLDGPSAREQVLMHNLQTAGLVGDESVESLNHPTLAKDLSILQSLVLDEQMARTRADVNPEQADSASRQLGDLARGLLDTAINSQSDTHNLIQSGHALNHAIYSRFPADRLIDMEDRQGIKTGILRQVVENSSDTQLQRLFGRLTSGGQNELRAAMAAASFLGTGSDTPSDEELVAAGQLGSVAETWEAALEAVKQELSERGIEYEHPPAPNMPHSFAGFTPATQQAIHQAAQRLADANRIPERGILDRGALNAGFRALIADQLNAPPSGSLAREQSVDDIPQGVCEQFYVDLGRAQFSVETKQGPQELLPQDGFNLLMPNEQSRQRGQAIDRLNAYVGRDQLMRASQYLNQAVFTGAEAGLMSLESPLKLDDEPVMPIRGNGSVNYLLSKQDNGDLSIRANVSWVLKGLQAGGDMLPLDRASSSLSLGLTLTLPANGGPAQLSDTGYDIQMRRSPDLSVQ